MRRRFIGSIGLIVCTAVAGAGAGCPRGGTDTPRKAPASPTACDEGKLWACFELGKKYAANQKDPQAMVQARRYFKTACEGGLVSGCDELRKMDEKLCGNGVPDACYQLGEMYRLGNKVIRADPAKARSYHKAACSEGAAAACYQLGLLWLQGKGGAVDETRGKYYLQEACKAKHPDACKRLER